LLFSIAQPVEVTTRPPPTCTTGIEIPKKARTWVPIRYDPTSKKKLFLAIRKASAFRVSWEYSAVNEKKTGLPPNGFTMGNRALRTRSRLLAASSTIGSPAANYC
jgi:hypothetical protein